VGNKNTFGGQQRLVGFVKKFGGQQKTRLVGNKNTFGGQQKDVAHPTIFWGRLCKEVWWAL